MTKYFIFLTVFFGILSTNLFQELADTSIQKDISNIIYDSLATELNLAKDDTTKINLLNKISWEFIPTQLERGKLFADSAMAISKKIDWKKGIGEAHNNIGDYYFYNGQIEKAVEEHKIAIEINKEANSLLNLGRSYQKLGVDYHNLSKISDAFHFFKKSREIFEKLDYLSGLQAINNSFGTLLVQAKDYEQAEKYYKKALEIAEQRKDSIAMSTIYGDLGLTQNDFKNYDKAIEYFEKALDIHRRHSNIYGYAINLGNLAIAYTETGQFDKSENLLFESLRIAEELNDKYGVAYNYSNIGELYYKKSLKEKTNKNILLQKSVDYLNRAIIAFTELKQKPQKVISLLALSDTYKELKQYDKALEVYELGKRTQDSTYTAEIKQYFADLDFNQRLDLQEKEIEILKKEKAYENYIRKLLFAFALILLFFSFAMLLLYFKLRSKNEALIESVYKQEQTAKKLKENQEELNSYKGHLEELVEQRTSDLEKEIKQRKEIEEELLHAIDRAETASNAKTVFLANMSHELRTPLVGILGYSDLLSKEAKDEETRVMASGINRTGNKLLDTLSLILDLARIESDKFEISISNIDVVEILREVYLNFKGIADSKKLNLIFNPHNDKFLLDSDRSMLAIIFNNLVNNAIKFTSEGTVEIKTEFILKNFTKFLLVQVEDSGIGIDKRDIPLIFTEFKQLSEGTIKEFPGTGLGLSITKKYVELLDGQIIVESTVGKGSIFKVYFEITTSSN